MKSNQAMESEMRIERDSMGEVSVPREALYGAQTQRALNNFTIADKPMPWRFIEALLHIKTAAAEVNRDLELLSPVKAESIVAAVNILLEDKGKEHFPVPVYQTGSGTSTNMNVNEAITALAHRSGVDLSPNDDVNMGQSSNDVVPSALHIAAAKQVRDLAIPSLSKLAAIIDAKAEDHLEVVKTGRTHLMDALPIRLSNELKGWVAQINDNIGRLESCLPRLLQLPLGGTAVGSGVNCHPDFAIRALEYLSAIFGLNFTRSTSAYKGISSIDTILELSGHLKTTAASLMKIANDLRWMNSGPNSGLGDISLPALQPGSSIMPDKVNPVIPEAVCMAAARIFGNDVSISIAAQSGNFQLNTMLPLAAADLLESGELAGNACVCLGEKAIRDMHIRIQRLQEPLVKNPILATALAPYIGYLEAARIAKMARQHNLPIMEVARNETDLSPELLEKLLDPRHLADGGTPPGRSAG